MRWTVLLVGVLAVLLTATLGYYLGQLYIENLFAG